MRISDWSSDVCSSDLADCRAIIADVALFPQLFARNPDVRSARVGVGRRRLRAAGVVCVRQAGPGSLVILGVQHVRERVDVEPAVRGQADRAVEDGRQRSEEHTSELQSLMRTSYAVFCLKQKNI